MYNHFLRTKVIKSIFFKNYTDARHYGQPKTLEFDHIAVQIELSNISASSNCVANQTNIENFRLGLIAVQADCS